MSMFQPDYSMVDPGTPGWELAPIPWWGMNPMAAGPRRVGVGHVDETSELPVLRDWGVVPDVVAMQQTVAHYQPSPHPSYALALGQRSCGCSGVGEDEVEARYRQVSWGHVAAAAAGGIFLGLIIGWAAGKRAKMRPNRPRRPGRRRRGQTIRGVKGRALSPTGRKRLPDSAFVFPERRSFPIHDEYHAVKALQFAKWPQHRGQRSQVLRAVGREYGRDPEVAERAFQYFPQSAGKYGFSRRAAERAAA